jgi:thiosulfate/3-mercaptopyruvate sulfurtransferase
MHVFVDPDQVESYDQSSLVVLDVRWSLDGSIGRDDYLRGHIPGAQFVDLDRDLSAPPGSRGRHPLPRDQDLIEVFERLGVTNDSTVLCYDQSEGLGAARCWALLGHLGHERVHILRGGLRAWELGGRPLEVGSPPPAVRGKLTRSPSQVVLVDKSSVQDDGDRYLIIDARARARYRGEIEPIDHTAGHIPGAYSLPLDQFFDGGKTPLPAEQWVQGVLAESIPLDPSTSYVTYCGSGVSAALLLAGLVDAGFRRGALYVGSWSEWIEDPASPIATGDER